MKTLWKYTAIFSLLLIGTLQVLPFVPTHSSCEATCCQEMVSCCEQESSTSCEMSMTTCDVTLFIPLISAPLIKITTDVTFDVMDVPAFAELLQFGKYYTDSVESMRMPEAPPPEYLPLLI